MNTTRFFTRLLLAAAVTFGGAAGSVQAQTQTPGGSTDAYRTATRLGGSRSLYAACRPTRNQNCIRTQASLQRAMKNARFQKEVANAMDAAGLTGLTQRVIDAFASGEAKEISFEQGRTMEWMAYYNPKTRGADLIRMIKWGGRQPFGAYEVTIEEGPKTYTFVMPKPCGNLALASVVEAPVPECPTVNVQRDCDGKTLSFRVASPGQHISRIEVRREGSDQVVSVLRSENSFASGNLPMAGGRYTFKAFDQYGRETKMCQAVAVEECPVPKPVVVEPTCPPITMTATRVRGRYQVAIDASAARSAEVAPTLVLESVDAQVEQNGQMTQTIALDSNGQATVLLPKGTRPGTFRFRGKVSYDGRELNNKLYQGSRDCEYTVALEEYEADKNFFVGGYVGKMRYVVEDPDIEGLEYGVCTPLIGLKGGAGFRLGESGWEVAPAIGIAFATDDDAPNPLGFADLEFNRVFEKGYVGTGIGVWDFTRGDNISPSWLLHFGREIHRTNNDVRIFFAGEGRLFLDRLDDADNNYQIWGGLRFVFPMNR